MEFDLLIKDGRIVTPLGVSYGDIGIRDGRIAAIAGPDSQLAASSTLDAEGRYVIPGIVDPHVHLASRNPFPDDVRTESRAAAAGGVTTIGVHLNVKGENLIAGFERGAFEDCKKDFESNSAVDGFFHVPIKDERSFQEMPVYPKIGITSYKLTWGEVGAAGDVGLYRVMERLSELGDRVRGIIHAENREIAAFLADRLVSQGRKDFPAWNESRPWFCEAEFMEKSILFAEVTKCPIYFEHVTIGRAMEILTRAKLRGVNVKAETCPQYLTLTSAEKGVLPSFPPYGHVNPPLRDKQSNDLLWEGIAKGIIDCIGSDHAPYTTEQKGDDLWAAPPGIGNIMELTLPLLLSEGVNKGRISIEKLVEICCYAPAKIFGVYPKKGAIAVGADADLVIVDDSERRKVSAKKLHSLCDWTVYEGWELKGWPVATLLRGKPVAKKGEIMAEPGTGRWLPRPC
ncbi:MAG: amidohydrolase family protein [Deltaproteobacteria bacterium]|nr:amidohydrolase family protein [Deltaproteobacteria bacterium]